MNIWVLIREWGSGTGWFNLMWHVHWWTQQEYPSLGNAQAHIIWWTIDSINPNSEKLFRMCPYCEHNMKLEMFAWEMMELQTFSKELVVENPLAGSDTWKHFYIKFCQSMLHPHLNPKHPEGWVKPMSLKAWSNSDEKMIKLNVLATIIKHHLQKDGQCLLTTDEDYVEPDHIVVYLAFPLSNGTIFDILSLYGIQAVELNGSLTTKKQQSAINTFRKSTCTSGLQVLILSNVGIVGLNLACPNIMITVDTTWSGLDDEQLKGWIFHYPQQKQVHFYQLITLCTPNVFLNMSFNKGQLHNAFIECMFQGTMDNDYSILSIPNVSDDEKSKADQLEEPKSVELKPVATHGHGHGGDPVTKCDHGRKPHGHGKQKVQDDDTMEFINITDMGEDDTGSKHTVPSRSSPKMKKKRKKASVKDQTESSLAAVAAGLQVQDDTQPVDNTDPAIMAELN
ncbi:hypothetical protein F5141DRAFT_1065385 [Pisolithus sp. B1]|nr:hypothetical protein F5141DRAFT_1065385 [Pisolithus sp. B1]